MDKRKRIEYLITTMCVLLTGFFIYGPLGSINMSGYDKWKSFLMFGLLGGFGFSAVVSTLILATCFFSKRKLVFKIVAAIFWPITFGCAAYVGMIIYVPYQIYNIVKLIGICKSERKNKGINAIEELSEDESWQHVITGVDGNVSLFGVNIFDYKWEPTGMKVEVLDPLYKQRHEMYVYKVVIEEEKYEFAAGEFSNCVWGFYTRV